MKWPTDFDRLVSPSAASVHFEAMSDLPRRPRESSAMTPNKDKQP
jgi:hypothetical protein